MLVAVSCVTNEGSNLSFALRWQKRYQRSCIPRELFRLAVIRLSHRPVYDGSPSLPRHRGKRNDTVIPATFPPPPSPPPAHSLSLSLSVSLSRFMASRQAPMR